MSAGKLYCVLYLGENSSCCNGEFMLALENPVLGFFSTSEKAEIEIDNDMTNNIFRKRFDYKIISGFIDNENWDD